MYSHGGIKLSCDKWRIMENEWGVRKTKRAPLLPIKPMLENRVYAWGQDFLMLKPRVRETHPGAPQNQRWEERALLAGSLAHGRKERGRDRLIKVTSSASSRRESYWGRQREARLCWEILHGGGNIRIRDFIFPYQLYKNSTFLTSSKFGSRNSY